jgi:hypothetical protein
MATHRETELIRAARTLGSVARELGLDPRQAQPPQLPQPPVREPADDEPAWSVPSSPRGGVFDFEAPEPIRRAA